VEPGLFSLTVAARESPPSIAVIGTQKDIRYYEIRSKSVLNSPEITRMGFWSINPYVGCAFGCAYCYARYTHRYVSERTVASTPDARQQADFTELPPWLGFERRIFVKRNAAEMLRAQLGAGRGATRGASRGGRKRRVAGVWDGESIVIGTATDPYQPAERRYRVTRGILEVLAEERGLSVGIITKSPLITRDVDVLARLVARSELTVHVSLITLDRDLARRIEPRAPTPEARLRAVSRLAEAGIETGVNVMPVLPGLTDGARMLDALVQRVAAAGASYLNTCALRLQAAARERYLPFIEQEFPALATRYRAAYARGYQVGERYREGLRRFLEERCAAHGIRYGSEEEGDPDQPDPGGRDAALASGDADPAAAGDSGEQLALGLHHAGVVR
jgi:DNA repair photolyase